MNLQVNKNQNKTEYLDSNTRSKGALKPGLDAEDS